MKKMKLFIALIVFSLILTACTREESTYYTGTVESDRYDVSSEVGGIIKKLYVHEGDSVPKGGKIALIDVTELEIELSRLQSELGSSKSTLEKAKSGFRSEEIDKVRIQIGQQDSIISSKTASYENILENYNRTAELYENGAASKQMLDDARTALDMSKSDLDSASGQREYLSKQLELMVNGPTKEDIQIPEGKYSAMLWSIKNVENKISKRYIYSNSNGIVESLNFLEGEYAPLFSKIASINDISNTWAKIYVEEKNLHNISLGKKVRVMADFLKDKPFEGVVTYVSSEGEFTPKNIESKENKQEIVYEVKVQIKDPDSVLKPGTLVDVYLGDDANGE
ncbi:HlyD family secretion protein [Peptoclostridium litorale DSM 5388]|uniref:Auxiliary transport protein, membrane fusion protein (MFP) family protein n=1 Tax=Peptoclostridium litorale DSM 5388 TaxID=1121324 RepID=A0A069RFB8_PEPLI|nr:efflux RND transporter periplasmic adaptor subunit [Peptoclostridium litorale]KDR95696.1 auxiliary transport protein, membrane fusion protein (MFP) family protein [Peptoclostridium litorale DSM 5388]SIO01315.1 HlyD family secretion protein [Peptoclostridium litorale DSM 5388]